MRINYLKKTFRLGLYIVLLITFGIGGFLQLFIGIPNTLVTYIVVGIFSFFLFSYTVFTVKIILNKTVLLFLLFGMLIILSGIVNKSGFAKTSLYLLYFLLPFSTYMFFRINAKKNYVSEHLIKKIFFYIACFQLPIMIFQNYAYPLLVKMNRSGQGIIDADIMFGSFFLKADHALGLFLLFSVFNIVVNNTNKEITKYPLLMYLYFGATIMYSESNITKLMFLIFTIYTLYRLVPRKIKIIGLIVVFFAGLIAINEAQKIEAVQGEIEFVKYEYNAKKSYRNFERGIAKRPQVVIAYATKIPIKIIGDGPYSYFNILKREFTLTQHFSQIIWTYADLGILGLIIFVLLLFSLIKSLGLASHMTFVVFALMIVYSFMTTIFSDVAIMITLISLLQKRKIVS